MKQRYRFLLLLIGFLPTLSTYSYDFEVDEICYTVTSLENFVVTVDGFKPSLSGIVEIPSTVTFNNRSFKVTSITSAKGATIESVNIPSSVTTISGFSGTSIKHLFIPDNVISIGSFAQCKNLKTIRLSNNIETLVENCFNNCVNLEKVEWEPKGSCRIEEEAFYRCKSLKTFKIPAGCSRTGNSPDWYRESQVSFRDCFLDTLIIGDHKGTIYFGSYYDDFYNENRPEFYLQTFNYLYLGKAYDKDYSYYRPTPNFSAQHLVIGDSVESLPIWPGVYKTIVIGKSIKQIRSFLNNSTLEMIKIKQNTPPEAVGFSNYNYINTILYVPKGAKANYESADIWKNFWNIVEYSDDGTEVETKKCARPTISYQNGKLMFDCATEGATCQSTITDSDISSYSVNEVQLGVTYNIRVYATKPGYENSEVATATLCWIEQLPEMRGIAEDEDNVTEVKATPVLIQSEDGTINVKGAEDGTNVSVYEVNGRLAGSMVSYNGHANIRTNLQSGSTAIVKIADRSIKVLIK